MWLFQSTSTTMLLCSVKRGRYDDCIYRSLLVRLADWLDGDLDDDKYSVEQIGESMRELGHSEGIIQALVRKL
jgi:hypothetical protein